jgi:hypothetical protein
VTAPGERLWRIPEDRMAGGDQLQRGRKAFARSSWREAYDELSAADNQSGLAPEPLDELAIAAYLIGRETDATTFWTRAHHAFIDAGRPRRAARCGFWLSVTALLRGEGAPGSGWLARAQRLLDDIDDECVEGGLLLILRGVTTLFRGDAASAAGTFEHACDLATRLADTDLLALALLGRGQAAIELNDAAAAVDLFDEAMVAVTAGEVSPIIAGVVYCAVILACQDIFDLQRARQWTTALARWCGRQPELVSFRMRDAGFRDVDVRRATRTLRVPPPEQFLWQYVHSTPMAAVLEDLDEARRAALERDVCTQWQAQCANGAMNLQVEMTTAIGWK